MFWTLVDFIVCSNQVFFFANFIQKIFFGFDSYYYFERFFDSKELVFACKIESTIERSALWEWIISKILSAVKLTFWNFWDLLSFSLYLLSASICLSSKVSTFCLNNFVECKSSPSSWNTEWFRNTIGSKLNLNENTTYLFSRA